MRAQPMLFRIASTASRGSIAEHGRRRGHGRQVQGLAAVPPDVGLRRSGCDRIGRPGRDRSRIGDRRGGGEQHHSPHRVAEIAGRGRNRHRGGSRPSRRDDRRFGPTRIRLRRRHGGGRDRCRSRSDLESSRRRTRRCFLHIGSGRQDGPGRLGRSGDGRTIRRCKGRPGRFGRQGLQAGGGCELREIVPLDLGRRHDDLGLGSLDDFDRQAGRRPRGARFYDGDVDEFDDDRLLHVDAGRVTQCQPRNRHSEREHPMDQRRCRHRDPGATTVVRDAPASRGRRRSRLHGPS